MKFLLESLTEMWALPWRHRHMIGQMIRRDIIGRYQGSMLGLGWSLVQPLIMLLVYTFVFSTIFTVSRWGAGAAASGAGTADFVTAMFLGLIVHTLFSECAGRAPTLVVSNVNYVKKVVFPLETMAWTTVGTALFHALMSVVIWIAIFAGANWFLPWTIVLLPLVILPMAFFLLGLVWFFASLGVFLRDLGQLVALLTLVLMFLSPIFYPVSAVPERYRAWMRLNPLTNVIEEARNVAMWGELPDWWGLALSLLVSLAFAFMGFVWFRKTRPGFNDVL
jgi:lipopolysaccharide transport system permease protein